MKLEEVEYYKGVALQLWTKYGPVESHRITDKTIELFTESNEELPLARAKVIKKELDSLAEFYSGSDENIAEKIAKDLLTIGTVEENVKMLDEFITLGDPFLSSKAVLTKAALLRITQKAN